MILPFIFITISWRIVIPGLLYLCDKMIYIQIHLGQCDLYYMVENYFIDYFILIFLMIKMLQYKMYPAGELRCPTTALVVSFFFFFFLKEEKDAP